MKILHAVHTFPPEFVGGTERYLEALTRAQVARGHDVVVVAGSERPGTARVEEDLAGVRVVRLEHDPEVERYSVDLRIPRLEAEFDALLERERPDVCHVHHWLNLGVPLVGLAARRGIPAVVSLHDFTAACPRFFLVRPDGGYCGDDVPVPAERCVSCVRGEFDGSDDELAEEFRLRRRFFDAELAAAAAVLAPSRRMRDVFVATGRSSVPAGRIEVLPLGLLDRLEPAPRTAPEDGRLRVVHFGNLAPVKGVDLLLDAVAGLDEARRGRVEVTLLGRPTDEASAADLAPRIERVGARHEESFDRARLERLAAEADVAVFPGIAPETYALVVDEALALGLPVIVSDRGAGAERAGEAALVVPAGDVDALRDALAGLLDDPGRLDTLRARIVEHVATVDDGAARLDEIYGAAVGTEPTPAPAHASLPTERLAALDRVVARHRRERASASSNGAGAPEVVAGDEAAASPPPPPPPPPEVARRGFDPEFRFVPLLPFEEVPGGRVVVLAPHPDDEVIGAGGALALHAARGDEVTVVHVTDGGATAARDVRRREAEAAGAELGVRRFRGLDFPDGGLRPGGAFESGLMGVLHTLRPDVLYVPSPFEHHPDHRATLALAAGALARGGLAPEVVLYEVNEPQQAGYLLDVTSVLEKKRAALERFESQRGTLDVVEKTLTANRARTVNVDLPAVRAAEAYLRVRPDALDRWIDAVFALRALVPEVAAAGGVAAAAAAPSATLLRGETVPVTCVISTWNKCDDVRENLLALHRQTRPPAEIVVVDNASKDGTQEMIRTEFPDVRLIVTPHDRIGACETFNMGFKAATQPLTAIMDDDVVAPPDWLEKLVTRLEREPESTAMVSSKVVEPGMPEEFLTSDAVNRERYMATFRGCGTLARTDVIRAAGLYDEEFFIYGNERDLATRVLNLGHRILQYPPAEIFHKTPFGLKPGKRSLYYHVRNFWLYAFKNCSWGQVLRAGWTLGLKGLGLKKDRGHASDATGTIGIDRSVKETPGGLWIAIKATLAALALLPYCLRHRHVCTHPDFEPPVQ